MNYLSKGVLTGATIAALMSLPILGHAGQAPVICDARASRVNAVKLAQPIENTVDFSGSNGGFDPIPLLVTVINVGGRNAACVIAHFSAQVEIEDNTVVFQASIDDNPMEGHILYPDELRSPQLITPIVLAKAVFSQTKLIPVPTTVSYNFFMTVKPGVHAVRIKWAGCCSSDPASASVTALAAVLTVEYRGGDGDN